MNASKIRPDLSKVHMHGQVSKDLVTFFSASVVVFGLV